MAYWPGERSAPSSHPFYFSEKACRSERKTGTLDTKFGIKGEIDMKVGYTGVPLVYKNMIFVGAMIFGPGEQHLDAGTYIATGPPMNPAAYDARSATSCGSSIPFRCPESSATRRGLNGSWKDKIGPNVWAFTLTLDEQRGIVYLPIGGPNNNYYGGNRPGDNLFSNTLVAVNVETGKRIWHFQTVHHESVGLRPAAVARALRYRKGRQNDSSPRAERQAGIHVHPRPHNRHSRSTMLLNDP